MCPLIVCFPTCGAISPPLLNGKVLEQMAFSGNPLSQGRAQGPRVCVAWLLLCKLKKKKRFGFSFLVYVRSTVLTRFFLTAVSGRDGNDVPEVPQRGERAHCSSRSFYPIHLPTPLLQSLPLPAARIMQYHPSAIIPTSHRPPLLLMFFF